MPTDPGGPAPRRGGGLILAVFALGLAAIVGTTVAFLPSGPKPPPISVIGGSFRLESSKGGVLDSRTLLGKPYLVFFGFTQCPNVCPTTLADLGNLLDAFAQENAKQGSDIQAYYVTVDPERDTPAVMREYMASFSDRITGLTGSPHDIERVTRAFRAEVKRVPLTEGGTTIEHSLMVYMMDRDGGFAGPLDLEAGHPLALKQLHRLVAGGRDS
ncbi:photosynthetic protein synthase I [Methylobacterium sp. Leaf456]|uniref:SCO family protein n=1 Tax=Methylobacterium sp. Leaf456 TaxID=1736382 RepID=UPI000701D21B|nr:SCO family protein [Methylobacterium sp. Leaf456]KQT57637.1 photosynthetic protein synthase I [Methylobacterium sp. Leaf456]